MDKNEKLFYRLLKAETEQELDKILGEEGLLNDDSSVWHPYGDMSNNTFTIGNQQSEPTPAFVEKIVNSIDAILMAECWKLNIQPESPRAPRSMAEAAEKFFGIRRGRLENEPTATRTKLAGNIHIVVVGSKEEPNYLIIDRGEGQSPDQFPNTLLSIGRDNKVGIHFVQGKYNAGGTGVLYFCGEQKYQLVVSRRHPQLPVPKDDLSKDGWGFTIVRRLLPTEQRLNSSFVYLAPNGKVPRFSANEIKVLPSEPRGDKPPLPYVTGLKWGTCIKLYAYKWKARSIATTETRYELEKYLYTLCLPVRLTETRAYKAHYFSTTISGTSINIADDDADGQLESGFPDSGSINLEGIGELPLIVTVYKSKDSKGEPVETRRIPKGIAFTVNGQVHGRLPESFISNTLDYSYIAKYMVVAVDCTKMAPRVREEFFMTSRERFRIGDKYEAVEQELIHYLKDHERLRQLNAQRRLEHVRESLTDEEPLKILQELLRLDPSLAALLSTGTRISDPFGPGIKPEPYQGKRFPTFFRIYKEPKGGLIKDCPINQTCRVIFETDAVNDYFSRGDSPGKISFSPDGLCRSYNLSNGYLNSRFGIPADAAIGNIYEISVEVMDESRVDPLECKFKIKVTSPKVPPEIPPRPPRPRKGVNLLGMPQITEVHEAEWAEYDFDKFSGLKVQSSGEGGFDIFINMDNIHLLSEIKRENQVSEHDVIRYWFKYGLALVTMGMIQEYRRTKDSDKNNGERAAKVEESKDSYLEDIGKASAGIARVIIPVIRRLSQGPPKPK